MSNNPVTELQKVQWKDLVPLTRAERAWELSLPLPWLILSSFFYHRGWWCLGLIGSFFLFLTGLRLSHNAQHCALGLSRRHHDLVLLALSVIMLASMHAVRVSHLHHHRHCLDEEDAEGSAARLKGWQAIVAGPFFLIRLHRSAWYLAEVLSRRWIVIELAAIAFVLALALAGCVGDVLAWHFSAMLAGECLTGFFAVWTVHHGCESAEPGRTHRGRWFNAFSYSMFLHAEHHLFPAVPTIHLSRLAKRLDSSGTEVSKCRVFPQFGKEDVYE